MKKYIYIILIFFIFSNITLKADDIRDFQIENISIGDSLFDHLSAEKIDWPNLGLRAW